MSYGRSNPGRGKSTWPSKNRAHVSTGANSKEDIATHDLLGGGNRYFKATFDYSEIPHTPRAHFIFLAHSPSSASGQSELDEFGNSEAEVSAGRRSDVTATDYQDLTQTQKDSLMEAVESLRKKFCLDKVVFSIHRGTWVINKNVFHTHLCVDTDQYLGVYRDLKSDIPDWPNSKHVTKQWRASRRPDDYEINVRGYPIRSYHHDEVRQIESIRRNVDRESQALESSDTWGVPSLRLVFHPSQPRIGFASDDTTSWETCKPEGRVHLLDTLDWFAAKHEMTEKTRGEDTRGCHVCLVLDKASRRSVFPADTPVVGYIQMSGVKFYEMCPQELKDKWFGNFRGEDGNNYT